MTITDTWAIYLRRRAQYYGKESNPSDPFAATIQRADWFFGPAGKLRALDVCAQIGGVLVNVSANHAFPEESSR